jgi:hypothetical protein
MPAFGAMGAPYRESWNVGDRVYTKLALTFGRDGTSDHFHELSLATANAPGTAFRQYAPGEITRISERVYEVNAVDCDGIHRVIVCTQFFPSYFTHDVPLSPDDARVRPTAWARIMGEE